MHGGRSTAAGRSTSQRWCGRGAILRWRRNSRPPMSGESTCGSRWNTTATVEMDWPVPAARPRRSLRMPSPKRGPGAVGEPTRTSIRTAVSLRLGTRISTGHTQIWSVRWGYRQATPSWHWIDTESARAGSVEETRALAAQQVTCILPPRSAARADMMARRESEDCIIEMLKPTLERCGAADRMRRPIVVAAGRRRCPSGLPSHEDRRHGGQEIARMDRADAV